MLVPLPPVHPDIVELFLWVVIGALALMFAVRTVKYIIDKLSAPSSTSRTATAPTAEIRELQETMRELIAEMKALHKEIVELRKEL